MILYSKSGDFLGIGKDELSFLGYEDLDEFKSVHSDVADLFVNKPGYIFKFKNFSWIDYALHSGAPKKSVILKLNNGNEVEVSIKIKELFLYNQKENEELYYTIEFMTSMSQNNSTFMQTAPASEVSTPIAVDKTLPLEESFQEKEIQEKSSLEEDFTVDFNSIEEEPAPKLKVDNAIAKEEEYIQKEKIEPTVNINDTFTEDYESDEIPKLKMNLPPEKEKETMVSFESSSEPVIEKETEEESVDFDLVHCVEELGLDISLVGELITDFINKIDRNIPKIKISIENKDEVLLKNSIYELKGISDNLHMIQLSNKLENILKANDTTTKMEELIKFEKIVVKFRGELI